MGKTKNDTPPDIPQKVLDAWAEEAEEEWLKEPITRGDLYYELEAKDRDSPEFIIHEGRGYLKLRNTKIPIGKSYTQKSKLAEILFQHFGKQQTIDVVYGFIKEGQKRTDPYLEYDYLNKSVKKKTIEQTWKEIQRALAKHYRRRLFKLKFDRPYNRHVWVDSS